MLAKLLDWYRAERPDCAACSIHWQSWDEIGMAMLGDSNVGTKGILKMEFIPPAEGIDHLCRELEAGLPSNEVLITDGFFERTFCPFMSRGRLDAESASDKTAHDAIDIARLSLVESIQPLEGERGGGGIAAEIHFDPAFDPFLLDHQLRGKPLLPAVVALEAQAEAAALCARRTVAAVRNVRMVDGLAFHTDRKIVARVNAVPQADGTIECELVADFHNRAGKLMQKDRVYQQATVEIAEHVAPLDVPMPNPPAELLPFTFPTNMPMYHGPTLQGLTGTAFDEQGGWAAVVALPLGKFGGARPGRDWLIPATLLDAAFYVCGTHSFVYGGQVVSLPQSIERVRRGRMPRDNERCVVHFHCREIEPQYAIYDFTIFGDDRTAIVAVEGHRIVMLRQ